MNSYKIWLCIILVSPLKASFSSTSSHDSRSSTSTLSSDLEAVERQDASSFQGSQNQNLQVEKRLSENGLGSMPSILAARASSYNTTSPGAQKFHTLERKLSNFNRKLILDQHKYEELMEVLKEFEEKILFQDSENREKLKEIEQQLLEYQQSDISLGLSGSILGDTTDKTLLGSFVIAQKKVSDVSKIITRCKFLMGQIKKDFDKDKKDESLTSLSSSEEQLENHNNFAQESLRPPSRKKVSFSDFDEMNGARGKPSLPLLQLTGKLVDTNLYGDKKNHSNNSSVKNRSKKNNDDDDDDIF